MSPRRRFRIPKLPVIMAVSATMALAMWFRSRDQVRETVSTTPRSRPAFRSLQERVQSASQRVMPAVVAVELPGGVSSSSGVIITTDGLILSQFHVSHRFPGWDGRQPPRFRQPGDRTMVVLSDGSKREAELLGADQTFDISLLRLIEPGPYSYVSLNVSSSVELGDWVLKLGHPLGYRRDRPPVVRLGRVLFQNSDMFVTDCFITGGDSGGPFFDLDGRLVGIIASTLVPAKLQGSFNRSDIARRGPFSSMSSRFIQPRLGGMLRQEISSFDELAWQRLNDNYRRDNGEIILPREEWTQGQVTTEPFQDVIRDSRPSVVSILDEADHEIAYGTIVEADGLIVTLATSLPAKPRCRLSDGQIVATEVIGIASAYDIVLLKASATRLRAVKWTREASPVVGTILAAVGMSDGPLAIGVVSVAQRNMPRPLPAGTTRSRIHAEQPATLGKTSADGYLVSAVGETAAVAGVRPGDVILSIAGIEVLDDKDLLGCIVGLIACDRVRVCLIRGGIQHELTLDLAALLTTDSGPDAGFLTLFEHDMPLSANQCGGPVVDLNGEAVGITISRGQYGCMAIPGDCVKRMLPKLGTGWPRR